MISIEEAHKINDFLDQTFKFKVGDFVQPSALGEFVETPVGNGSATKDSGKNWSFSLSFRDTIRYQIVERWIQQCHGGVQLHYHCKLITKEGAIDKGIFTMTEMELVLSAPFRNGEGLSPEKIREFADKAEKDLSKGKDPK